MAWQRSDLKKRSITYTDTDQPQKHQLISTITPIGYEDALGGIQPINMTPQRINNAQFNGWRVTNNGWHYGLETNGQVWFGGKRGQHFFKFRLSRIGYTQVDKGGIPNFANDFTNLAGAPTYSLANLSFTPKTLTLPDGDATVGALAEWRDLWPALPQGEINIRWALDGDRLKEEVVITQAAREWIATNRPPAYYNLQASQTWLTFAFQVDWSDIPKRYRDGVDLSASLDFSDAGGAIEGRTALDELLFFMPLDDAYVDETIDTGRTGTDGNPIYEARRTKIALRKRFWRNADGQWYLIVGAKVADLAALPAGDLIFDPTLNSDVAAGSDDATYRFGYNDTDDHIVVGMSEPGTGTNAGSGWRFDNITLSGSDTIDSVYVTMVSTVNQWGQMSNRWTFENSDDAATFSSGSIPGSRPIVATIVADSSNFNHTTGTAYNYPYASGDQDSLAAALQAVIDRAGWASGNAVALINQSGQDASVQYGYARIPHATYDHATYAAPRLVVNYTGGVSNVDKSASDSATLTDTATVTQVATITGSDSAALSSTSALSQTATLSASDQAILNEGLTLQASASATDTTSSSDDSALAPEILGSEAALLTEAVVVAEQSELSAQDSLVLAESIDLTAVLVGIDAGTQADGSGLNQSYLSTDEATATDTASTTAALVGDDSALLTDTGQLVQSGGAAASDSATLDENSTVLASMSDTDTGTVTDTSSLNQTLQATDSATVNEATSTSVQATGSEAFIIDESLTLTEARALVATDTAALSETATLSGGTDQIGNDSFALSEATALAINVGSVDTGTADEAIAIALPATDSASLSELVSAQVALSAADSSIFSEQSTRTGGTNFASNDSAALTETTALNVSTAATDAANLDTETPGNAMADTDSLVLEEASATTVSLTDSDSATVTDTGSRDAGASPTGIESFALSEAVVVTIVSESSDSANVSESSSVVEGKSATDNADLDESSALQMMVDHQGQEAGALAESVSIIVTLVSNDSAAGIEQPLPEGYVADDESATFSDSGQVVTGIYRIGNDGFWLTETTLLEAQFQRVDTASMVAVVTERSFASAEIYQLTDLAYGVGEGELPDTVIPGTFYHMLLLAHWQKVSGDVFKWRDVFWYVIQDNDRIIFKQVAFEPDLHHPFWGKYRGPVDLLKDEA